MGNYLISIYLCGLIPAWIIHVWLLHTWISRVWNILFWRRLLRLFVYLKECVAHPAFIISLTIDNYYSALVNHDFYGQDRTAGAKKPKTYDYSLCEDTL